MFDLTPSGEPTHDLVGIGIKGCTALRFENLTIRGAPTITATNQVIGVRIENAPGVGTTAIQFQNVSFMWCDVAVQTANTLNNSELAFYDCLFNFNRIGFQCLNDQALVHKFFGCVGGGGGDSREQYNGMETMFDLTSGGNVTVVGFGGQNMSTFVKVGNGGGNIGWNLFHNIRLEQFGLDVLSNNWGNNNRIRLYEAVMPSGIPHGQRTEFDGVVITPPGAEPAFEGGVTRFSLLEGHTVVLRNASRTPTYQFASTNAKLLDYPASSNRGGTLLCFNVSVPFDARLDRDDVPAAARYSFVECDEDAVPYPDLLNPPLYAPNYLMSVEYHCWAKGDALVGVNEESANTGNEVIEVDSDAVRFGVLACSTELVGHTTLISYPQALKAGESTWRFQAAARVTATATSSDPEVPEFEVRLGFNDLATGEGDNGVFFRYRNTFNSNRWEGVVRWAGTESALDTGVTKDEDWHTFEIELSVGGDVATFYMDGVRLGTASESPSEGDPTGLMPLQFVRLAGSGTKAAEIDYYKYEVRPSGQSAMYPE